MNATASELMVAELNDRSDTSKTSLLVWDKLINGTYEERESLLSLITKIGGESARASVLAVIHHPSNENPA